MEWILFKNLGLAPLAPLVSIVLALALTAFPAAAQEGTPVRVDKVISEPLSQTVPVIGRLVARQAGLVAARINGPVMEFKVEVGDRVTQDQIIALLDPVNLAARRDMAARASPSNDRIGTVRASKGVVGARGNVAGNSSRRPKPSMYTRSMQLLARSCSAIRSRSANPAAPSIS